LFHFKNISVTAPAKGRQRTYTAPVRTRYDCFGILTR
jgi:hypothetical protein